MEQWEYNLRDDIFSAFMMNNKKAATFLLQDLIEKKGGVFYRYRPLDMAEISSIRFDQMYLCRAVRFDNHTDGMLRFKSYVSCFTDRKNSLSMWNDYADAAQGLCMEYQYLDIQDFAEENGLFFSPVKYSDDSSENGEEDLVNIHRLGEGWVADEALAIALYCALRHQDDFSAGVIASVNHKGDSDSTGAITGNILGVINGESTIPSEWLANLREYKIVSKVADDLWKGFDEDSEGHVTDEWWDKYPGF